MNDETIYPWEEKIAKLEAENERLRELSVSAQKCAEEKTAMIAELHEQRDEIERLREQVNEMSGTFTTKESVLKDAERWRKARALDADTWARVWRITEKQMDNAIDAVRGGVSDD